MKSFKMIYFIISPEKDPKDRPVLALKNSKFYDDKLKLQFLHVRSPIDLH